MSLRQIQSGKASITLSFESSTIVDYIDVAPITLTERFEATLNIQEAIAYLAGSVKTRQHADRVTGLFRKTQSASGNTLQIWCKAYKID